MTRFRVIPVIDLRGGTVVKARAGIRDSYAPIVTPLASTAEPAEVAHGMLAACPSDTLYVADLDAIVDGVPPDEVSLAAIRAACPGVTCWVDAGFWEIATVTRFLKAGFGRPVLGSESQRDTGLVRALGDRAILSLDTRGDEQLGPAELHEDAALWPRDIIVMTLGRIGSDGGPDVSAVEEILARRPEVRAYAAGGIRGEQDIAMLERAGIAGALVASAIHGGVLTKRGCDPSQFDERNRDTRR